MITYHNPCTPMFGTTCPPTPYIAAAIRAGAEWSPLPGDQMCACSVLGIPYPPDAEHETRVEAQARLLVAYDYEATEGCMRRWMPDHHDAGDEDRS